MLDDILDKFDLSQPISVKQIKTGNINQTYKIMNSDGVFALQSLHTFFPDETLTDMYEVTNYLAEHGLRVPKLIKTKAGTFFTVDHNNLRWRLYSWIDGQVFESIKDLNMAKEAGALVGKLHKLLSHLDYRPTADLKGFHDTPAVLAKLDQVVDQLPADGQALAQQILTEAPKYFIRPEEQANQVIHGDLKISNLVFDNDQHAIGVIDFDTIIYKPRAIDLGDALRSWCNTSTEDDPAASFDMQLFTAAETAYRENFDANLNETEINLRATKLIALELAARFLTDVVTDNYFSFDDKRFPTRKAHNWARAQAQFNLAQSISI